MPEWEEETWKINQAKKRELALSPPKEEAAFASLSVRAPQRLCLSLSLFPFPPLL